MTFYDKDLLPFPSKMNTVIFPRKSGMSVAVPYSAISLADAYVYSDNSSVIFIADIWLKQKISKFAWFFNYS
jgi:hypothetical protein